MPKNTKKAKNAKNTHVTTRPFITKTEDQEYALVTKLFGNCRLECSCFDNKTRLGVIRNKMRRGKQNRVKLEDIVIVSKRDFQDDKADVIHVYTPEEVKRLIRMKAIPNYKKENEHAEEDVFVFDRKDDYSYESSDSEEKSPLLSKPKPKPKKDDSSSEESDSSGELVIDDI